MEDQANYSSLAKTISQMRATLDAASESITSPAVYRALELADQHLHVALWCLSEEDSCSPEGSNRYQ